MDQKQPPGPDDGGGSDSAIWAGVRGALTGFLTLGSVTMALAVGYLGFIKDCWG